MKLNLMIMTRPLCYEDSPTIAIIKQSLLNLSQESKNKKITHLTSTKILIRRTANIHYGTLYLTMIKDTLLQHL